jgi:prephenate dehydratase
MIEQSKKRVAIQGISGSFHEIAAREYFAGEEIEIIPCKHFKDVFNAIKKDNSIIGAVAIENTVAGSLLPNFNLLRESGFMIIGEYKLRIKQNLCVLAGQSIENIDEVHSHPIALMQCDDFLSEHPHLKLVESDDTASSARVIAENKIRRRAAICSSLAAQNYGLEIIAEEIETNKQNFTRFLIIADQWNIPADFAISIKADKSSLVFMPPHEEGSLSKILTILSFYGLNLTKIQSMPIIGRVWEYLFYVDLTFEDYRRYQQSLDAIRPLTRNLKILGEYKQSTEQQ